MEFWARRTILKNILGIIFFTACAAVLLWVAGNIVPWYGVGLLSPQTAQYACILAATLVTVWLFDRMPAAWVGLGLHRWAPRELAMGTAFGLGMALAAWLPVVLIAGVTAGDGLRTDDLWYWVLPIMVNAAGEELLVRGYLYQRGIEIFGPVVATLLSAAVFAVMHLGNPNATALSTVIIFLAGIFFALGYLRTGSLWFPIAAHAVWNLFLAKIAGAFVSGLDLGGTLLRTGTSGPAIITGGAFGPEGGVTGLVAVGLGVWALVSMPAITQSPYVYAQVYRAVVKNLRARNTPA